LNCSDGVLFLNLLLINTPAPLAFIIILLHLKITTMWCQLVMNHTWQWNVHIGIFYQLTLVENYGMIMPLSLFILEEVYISLCKCVVHLLYFRICFISCIQE
jgi:hypothetical protein